MTSKRTVLYDAHVKLNAQMVPFGGWDMPVTYGSIINEHMHTRTACSIFDVSHMGEIRVTGEKAEEYLSSLLPTRMNKLKDGFSMYSAFCNEKGGVIDDLFVYRKSTTDFFLVVNAATLQGDIEVITGMHDGSRAEIDTGIAVHGKRFIEGKRILFKSVGIDVR